MISRNNAAVDVETLERRLLVSRSSTEYLKGIPFCITEYLKGIPFCITEYLKGIPFCIRLNHDAQFYIRLGGDTD